MKTLKIYTFRKVRFSVFAFMVLTMTFIGCEQFDIEENPGASQLAVLPYSSIEELQLGVTGIYGKFNEGDATMTTFYVNGWSGDDMTTHRASNKADFREYDQRVITSDNSRTAINWAAVYAIVRAANTVLSSVEGQLLPNPDAQDRLTGETYFLRGLAFYHLARIHGRIPLVLDVDPYARPELATQLEVYAQIESDLLQAESLLPVASNLGASKPNKGSARAILARLYLEWAGFPVKDNAKYAQAAASAKQVIDNAGAHGFGLLDDVSSLWTIANRFNKESLFTVAFCQDCGLANRKYGKLGLPGSAPTNGWQETFAEIRFFEDFPEGARKEATYHKAVPLDKDGNIITDDATPIADSLPWTEFVDQQNPLFRKIVGPFEDNIWPGFESDRNDFYMRYAELLLIYAEASGRAGTAEADAWEALNVIHRRAAGLPINSPDASDLSSADGSIEELAYTERKWELAGEYQRWYDLVRMERVEEALGGTARNPRVSIGTSFDANGNGTPMPLTSPSNPILGSLSPDKYFAPIPKSEIEKNPNLTN